MNNIILNSLADEQIWSLKPDEQLYKSCMICKCAICSERRTCRNCYICACDPHPIFKCLRLQYQVFSYEPYKSYISELDKIYELEN